MSDALKAKLAALDNDKDGLGLTAEEVSRTRQKIIEDHYAAGAGPQNGGAQDAAQLIELGRTLVESNFTQDENNRTGRPQVKTHCGFRTADKVGEDEQWLHIITYVNMVFAKEVEDGKTVFSHSMEEIFTRWTADVLSVWGSSESMGDCLKLKRTAAVRLWKTTLLSLRQISYAGIPLQESALELAVRAMQDILYIYMLKNNKTAYIAAMYKTIQSHFDRKRIDLYGAFLEATASKPDPPAPAEGPAVPPPVQQSAAATESRTKKHKYQKPPQQQQQQHPRDDRGGGYRGGRGGGRGGGGFNRGRGGYGGGGGGLFPAPGFQSRW